METFEKQADCYAKVLDETIIVFNCLWKRSDMGL